MKCRACGHEQEEGKFCDKCGLLLVDYIPLHREENNEEEKESIVCPQCGVPTTKDTCPLCGLPLKRSESE